jgi:hypothetical protein
VPALRFLFPSGVVRPARLALGIAAAGLLVSACSSGSAPAPTSAPTQAPSSAAATPSATAPVTTAPGIVAATTAGALIRLNPATGATEATLVPVGVLAGGEISAAKGTVYFTVKAGCTTEIESVPATGGTVQTITAGSLPAVSPDGTRLAYTTQPFVDNSCPNTRYDLVSQYHLKIRTLSGGATVSLPEISGPQNTGLPAPISYLSWSADNVHLAVSIVPVQDNEGWLLNLVDTSQAKYYLSSPGVTAVPVTGGPSLQQSYLSEGAYLPSGDLFVSRACCTGFPVRNTSRLMLEIRTDGTPIRQVAIGYPTIAHTSLDASADGRWLLYVADRNLYVSRGGAKPRTVATGLTAAAWG